MNAPKMNLNPNKKESGKENKAPQTPEEIQAQFFADLGNALLNMSVFTGRIAAAITQMQKDHETFVADFQDFLDMKKIEMEKVHNIDPDILPSLGDKDEGEELEGDKDEPK